MGTSTRTICGIKLTHDGGVAVIENGRLRFSYEMEKIRNNRRYQQLDRLEWIEELLKLGGCTATAVDNFVVDGWHADSMDGGARLAVTSDGRPVDLEVASYHESTVADDPLRRHLFEGPQTAGVLQNYASYHHATDHGIASYCTSPFARRGESSLVLVWDGGMLPHLYQVEPAPFKIVALGPLFPITGNAFSEFSANFGPYWQKNARRDAETALRRNLEVAGKAMAYAALGRDERDTYPIIDELLDGIPDISIDAPHRLAGVVRDRRDDIFPGLNDADIIASFQGYLGQVLLSSLRSFVKSFSPDTAPNLCLSGGCALNIKWNSALRSSELFADVWVPPFPNDSGSAIGAACSEMVALGQGPYLEWDVYSGPPVEPLTEPLAGMLTQRCGPAELARLLHEEQQPITVLNGSAELGPRALGNRSIIAPPTSAKMKQHLNEIKEREDYRPVAPICLESKAREVFHPGDPDPYMLFDHRVRGEWADRVPAIVHLDGTARLQTVTPAQNGTIAAVLEEYEKLSGIPLLCNTSANYKGHGFFPDVSSAARWGGTDCVWSDGVLYRRSASS